MRLFAPDLYRNFAIGFAIGAALVALTTAEQWGEGLAPAARAAEASPTAVPSVESFLASGQQGTP